MPYADARGMHEGPLHHLGERLYQHAHVTGHFVDLAKRRGAPSMAQGCAASLSAVGPASAEPAGANETTPADPLSFCPEGQSLPVAATTGDSQAALEAA
jgi:hypothetical protein